METKFKDILEKMCIVYRKYGIKSITMDDVARENSISKKTLYKYVKDKSDLVKQTMLYAFSKHSSEINKYRNLEQSAIEDFFMLYTKISKVLLEHHSSLEYDMRKYYNDLFLIMENLKSKQVYDFIYSNLEKGIKQGIYIPTLNKVLIAKQQVMLLACTVDNEVVSYTDFLNEEGLFVRFTYHLRAVCNEKGLGILDDKFKQTRSK